jgi:hypothetical protein
MDSEGFVDIAVIASFNRIKSLTNDIELLRDTLALSPCFEVDLEGWRLRKRGDWQKWVLPNAKAHLPRPSPGATTKAREGDLENSMLMGNGGTADTASAAESVKAEPPKSTESGAAAADGGEKSEIRVDAAFPTGTFFVIPVLGPFVPVVPKCFRNDLQTPRSVTNSQGSVSAGASIAIQGESLRLGVLVMLLDDLKLYKSDSPFWSLSIASLFRIGSINFFFFPSSITSQLQSSTEADFYIFITGRSSVFPHSKTPVNRSVRDRYDRQDRPVPTCYNRIVAFSCFFADYSLWPFFRFTTPARLPRPRGSSSFLYLCPFFFPLSLGSRKSTTTTQSHLPVPPHTPFETAFLASSPFFFSSQVFSVLSFFSSFLSPVFLL